MRGGEGRVERGEEQLRRPNAAMRRECFLVGKVQRCTCWGAHPPPPSAHPPPCTHPPPCAHPQGRSSCGGRARRRPTKSRCRSPVFRRCTCVEGAHPPPCAHPHREVHRSKEVHTLRVHTSERCCQSCTCQHKPIMRMFCIAALLRAGYCGLSITNFHRELCWLLALKSYKPW